MPQIRAVRLNQNSFIHRFRGLKSKFHVSVSDLTSNNISNQLMAALAVCSFSSSQYAWRGSEMSVGDGVLDSGKASDLSVCSWPVEPIQWTPFPLLQQLASHRSPKVSVWLCFRQYRSFLVSLCDRVFVPL